MSADSQLSLACNEWRRLAESEGQAIRTRNWDLVADCHKALLRIQSLISRHTTDAREEWKQLGPLREEKENSLRAILAGLIEIQSRNSNLLDRMREGAQSNIAQLEHTGRTLRAVRQFYAGSAPPSWSSVS